MLHCQKYMAVMNSFDNVLRNQTIDAESHTQTTSANKQIMLLLYLFGIVVFAAFFPHLVYCNFVWSFFFVLISFHIHTHYTHYALQHVQTFVVFRNINNNLKYELLCVLRYITVRYHDYIFFGFDREYLCCGRVFISILVDAFITKLQRISYTDNTATTLYRNTYKQSHIMFYGTHYQKPNEWLFLSSQISYFLW